MHDGTDKERGESYKLFIRKYTKGNSKALRFHSNLYKFIRWGDHVTLKSCYKSAYDMLLVIKCGDIIVTVTLKEMLS